MNRSFLQPVFFLRTSGRCAMEIKNINQFFKSNNNMYTKKGARIEITSQTD